jgi:hypothetical protein
MTGRHRNLASRLTAGMTALLLLMGSASFHCLWAEDRNSDWTRPALVIGGGTAAGAAVGGMAGGKKGAAVGALAGGLGGTAYTLADRERGNDRPRTKTKSAVIIGGSSAAGATVGAVAGGGKGAAIGALAGGVGGWIYDLKTNNRR